MEHPEFGQTWQNLMPNGPVIDACDITEAMGHLWGIPGRNIAGITHSVDAGPVVSQSE